MVSKFREIQERIEAQLANQLKLRTQELWQMRRGTEKLPFITISREYGCQGYPVAEVLQQRLNALTGEKYPWGVFDKEVIRKVAEEHELSEALANSLSENQRSQMQQYLDHIFFNRPNEYKIFQYLTRALIGLAEKGQAILIGRGGYVITGHIERGFHVRLIAPLEFRKERIKKELGISENEAVKLVKKMESERGVFVEKYTLKSISDPHNFHLVVNNALYSPGQIADLLVRGLEVLGYV